MATRSEEHTSELQSRTLISYAVFCLKKKKHQRCWCNAEAYRRGGNETQPPAPRSTPFVSPRRCGRCRFLLFFFFFLWIRPPPRSTQAFTLFPCTTLFRSDHRRVTPRQLVAALKRSSAGIEALL